MALRTDPLAFGSTDEREAAYSEEKWKDWARRGATGEREPTFVAVDSMGLLRGMIGIFWNGQRSVIWGMWVDPTLRGCGAGRHLLQEALSWIDRVNPGSEVSLDVNPEQKTAVAMYLSGGFRFTGAEEPLGHHEPAIVKQMVRPQPSEHH